MANFAGWLMRRLGPLLPEHKLGRANLAAAFPEKSAAEIDAILSGVWDNLGRVGAEFAHLDRLVGFRSGASRAARAHRACAHRTSSALRTAEADGKPALIFAAHLANWELPAVCAATYGLDSAILYRRPNIAGIDAGCTGPARRAWARSFRPASRRR